MSPERAFNIVVNAAVAHWAADTRQHELRVALDQILGQLSDTFPRRILALKWKDCGLLEAWLRPDDARRQ